MTTADRVQLQAPPRPTPPWHALTVGRILYRAHRRQRRRLPGWPVTTWLFGTLGTLWATTYLDDDHQAAVIVVDRRPAGVAWAIARLIVTLVVVLGSAAFVTFSAAAALVLLVVAGAAVAAQVVALVGNRLSCRRARARWLADHSTASPQPARPPKPPKGVALRIAGFGATSPGAGADLARALIEHAPGPMWALAASEAHARLYRPFGFHDAGPRYYGQVPLLRP